MWYLHIFILYTLVLILILFKGLMICPKKSTSNTGDWRYLNILNNTSIIYFIIFLMGWSSSEMIMKRKANILFQGITSIQAYQLQLSNYFNTSGSAFWSVYRKCTFSTVTCMLSKSCQNHEKALFLLSSYRWVDMFERCNINNNPKVLTCLSNYDGSI